MASILSRLMGLCVAMLADWVSKASLCEMQTGATALQPTVNTTALFRKSIPLPRCGSCRHPCFFCWYCACIVGEENQVKAHLDRARQWHEAVQTLKFVLNRIRRYTYLFICRML